MIDEAYIDFGGKSAVTLINQYSNLIVTQTLSKSRSLAGIRLGYALGHADLIDGLVRVKDSFNSYPVDSLAIDAGVASFEDQTYFKQTCEKVISSREYLITELTELVFELIPSAANFVFACHPQHDAKELADGLRQQGVIVRHFSQDRITQYLRITIGTPDENQQLLAILDSLV